MSFKKSYLKIQSELRHISFLKIYDGGSEQAEIIANLNEAINGTKVSTPRNQIFVILDTNGNNGNIRLNAAVIESKYFGEGLHRNYKCGPGAWIFGFILVDFIQVDFICVYFTRIESTWINLTWPSGI